MLSQEECRYELYFPPPSELIIESQPFSGLHVSWWSQEQATKEAQSEGCRISCVLYLCKPLFQPNTKGEAWLNPFYFLVWLLCACARSRIHASSLTRMSPALFLCVLVYWRVAECGCWYVQTLHLVFPLQPISALSAARPVRRKARDGTRCRGGGL